MVWEEKYFLALADGDKIILDYIYFEIRGSETDRNRLPEEEKGALSH